MLELKNVKKDYNNHTVLEIPSLQIKKDIYWVKGANGSGKTTLLKMVAGLLPFDGDILFNNISLQNKPLSYRRNVSWAEAEPLFPVFTTGMDLIYLYLNTRKLPLKEANILIELFNMQDYINGYIGTYSAGMTKKLSLVLAFLGNPLLVVLDEPLITLDADAFKTLCNLILEKHKNTETTFLMSSHQELDTRLLISGKELTVRNRSVFN